MPDTSSGNIGKLKDLLYAAAYSDGSVRVITNEQGAAYHFTKSVQESITLNGSTRFNSGFNYRSDPGTLQTVYLSNYPELDNIGRVTSEVGKTEDPHLMLLEREFVIGSYYVSAEYDLSNENLSDIGEGGIVTPDIIGATVPLCVMQQYDSDSNRYQLWYAAKFGRNFKLVRIPQCVPPGSGIDSSKFGGVESVENNPFEYGFTTAPIQSYNGLLGSYIYLNPYQGAEFIPGILWFDSDNAVYVNGFKALWPNNAITLGAEGIVSSQVVNDADDTYYFAPHL